MLMPDRRLVATSLLIGTAGLVTSFLAAQVQRVRAQTAARAGALYAYVGCFTTAQRKARGDGIHVYKADPATGTLTEIQHIADLVNPSYLTLSHDQRFLFSVHGDETYASAFGLDPATGHAKFINQAATGGKNGVHSAVDPSGKFLVLANYSSGSVAVLAIGPDGALKDQHQLIPLPGTPGPHKVEQTASHPHHVVFDPSGRFVLVPDKGLDRIFVFHFDAATGLLSPTEQGSVQARAGAGARHVAFHPKLPIAWVLNEIDSTITVYKFDPAQGTLSPLQVTTTLPTDFTGNSTASEIAVAPDNRFVYVSNRGHDSVAIYAVNSATGLLSIVGWQPTQGSTPRFIGLDPAGGFLHAANEQGDTIVTFRVNKGSGKLTPTGQIIKNASPVTIAFAGK
jgi:6-phosphogluconolactonase (cycloisomerase 2 family)